MHPTTDKLKRVTPGQRFRKKHGEQTISFVVEDFHCSKARTPASLPAPEFAGCPSGTVTLPGTEGRKGGRSEEGHRKGQRQQDRCSLQAPGLISVTASVSTLPLLRPGESLVSGGCTTGQSG